MLGLGNSLITSTKFFSPNDVSNLIGWFDFGDITTIFQDDDGDTSDPVTSTGDHINTILNKSKLSTKICEWLESSGSDATPWNDSGYLDSAGGNNSTLVALSKLSSTVDGGTATSDLSTALVNFEAFAIFIVANPTQSGPSTDEFYFSLKGQDEAGATNQVGSIKIQHVNGSTGDGGKLYYIENTSGLGTQTTKTASAIAASKQVISVVTGSGTNASDIYINGSSVTSFTAHGDVNLVFDENPFGAPDLQKDHISISGTYSQNGALTTGSCVGGDLYEVLIYNKALTSSEINIIHNHLINKYNIS